MAGTRAWFANNAELRVVDPTSAVVTVAALKGVTIEPQYELVELYGMEDLRRAAIARHSLKINVNVKYAKWDATNDTIMAQVVGTDFTSASKNVPGMFTITATFKSIPASAGEKLQTMTATISDIAFSGVPYNMNENEFIVRELSGSGRSIEVSASEAA